LYGAEFGVALVVGALVLAGRPGVGRAYVRGTDGYISLGDYSRVMNTERDVGDGPTVVGALVFTGRSGSEDAHVRGTDGYIALGDCSRVMDTERGVGGGSAVVRASV